jgi:hypothetical protein
MPAETLSSPKLLESPSAGVHWWFDDYFSRLTSGSPAPWNLTTLSGLLALVILWAAWFATWAHWGNLTIDTGREMYIPAVLAEGKMLYRDIWFMYGPAAPLLQQLALPSVRRTSERSLFGVAYYLTLLLLIAARSIQRRSWKSIAWDLTAILPSILICVLVIRWMISIAGLDFILQENFMSWPTSYFIKTYDKFWLASTGFNITRAALADAAQRTFALLGILQGFHLLATLKGVGRREVLLRVALFLTALISLIFTQSWGDGLRIVFFPQDMGLYVALAAAAAWWYFWRHPSENRAAAMALLLTFAALLAFRILLRVIPWGYAIYYDGPVVLSFLIIARPLIPRAAQSRQFALRAELLLCIACLTVTVMNSRRSDNPGRALGVLATERGTIVVPKAQADQYQAAIQFMKEHNAHGEAVLSVPEDTSLYFVSGVDCPLRVFAFTPGLVVPGKMTDDVISQIERKQIRYLIW